MYSRTFISSWVRPLRFYSTRTLWGKGECATDLFLNKASSYKFSELWYQILSLLECLKQLTLWFIICSSLPACQRYFFAMPCRAVIWHLPICKIKSCRKVMLVHSFNLVWPKGSCLDRNFMYLNWVWHLVEKFCEKCLQFYARNRREGIHRFSMLDCGWHAWLQKSFGSHGTLHIILSHKLVHVRHLQIIHNTHR